MPVRAQGQDGPGQREHPRRHREPELDRPLEADQELLGHPRETAGEGDVAEVVGQVEPALVQRERKERQPDGSHEDDGRHHPAAEEHDQPDGLDEHQEERVVVAGDGQRRGDRPARQRAPGGLLARVGEAQQRERGEEHEQRVGARLLGVVDEQRADRGEPGHEQPGPLGDELASGQVGDADERGPGQRRQRAQPELAGPEQLGPEPGDHVVERRRRLVVVDAVEHLREVEVDRLDGDGLVQPVALVVEEDEPQQRGERDDRQRSDDPRACRGGGEDLHPARGYSPATRRDACHGDRR